MPSGFVWIYFPGRLYGKKNKTFQNISKAIKIRMDCPFAEIMLKAA